MCAAYRNRPTLECACADDSLLPSFLLFLSFPFQKASELARLFLFCLVNVPVQSEKRPRASRTSSSSALWVYCLPLFWALLCRNHLIDPPCDATCAVGYGLAMPPAARDIICEIYTNPFLLNKFETILLKVV